jgi:tryptophan synthase beta subunit
MGGGGCVGAGLFHEFVDDEDVQLRGVEGVSRTIL